MLCVKCDLWPILPKVSPLNSTEPSKYRPSVELVGIVIIHDLEILAFTGVYRSWNRLKNTVIAITRIFLL